MTKSPTCHHLDSKVLALIEVVTEKDTQEILKDRILDSLDWINVIIHYLRGYIDVLHQKHANNFLLNIVQ